MKRVIGYIYLLKLHMDFESTYQYSKAADLSGRYITLNHIEPFLQKWNSNSQLQILGSSVQGKPIYSFKIGHGKTKVLLWSQMHGNESTTTKSVFDLLKLLHSPTDPNASEQVKQAASKLLDYFTFLILPMVNPDGAFAYTRQNANNVDLNRDAQSLSQPESRALRKAFDNFKPDFCYNMHDQRTIFGAGDSGLPATISFLSPAFNAMLDINEARVSAMNVVVCMNNVLQQYIPQQIGRFDDSFNINCVGDTFQSHNVPTILFEAGHFQNDYQREETRKYIFFALLSGFEALLENVVVSNIIEDYLNIPQNKINFYDIVYKNVKINYDANKIITNFAVQFTERLAGNEILFDAYIAQIGNCEKYFGHSEFDAEDAIFTSSENKLKIGRRASFQLGSIRIVNGSMQA